MPPTAPDEPNSLYLMFIGIVLMSLIVGIIWGIPALWERFQERRAQRRTRPPRQHSYQIPEPQPQPATRTAQPAAIELPPTRPVLTRQWLDLVNNEPNRNPHVAAAGPSGSGKTTLILAVIQDRPGQFIITTPKNETTDPWGGLPAIRLGQDLSFELIAEAIKAVYEEVKRRNTPGFDINEVDWITLVIDEYPTVKDECKGIADIVLRMLRLARSVKVRLILISTETGVKALGLEGHGDARQNLIFIELDDDRSAIIYRWGKEPRAIDTSNVLYLANRPMHPSRSWEPPLPKQPADRPADRRQLLRLLDLDNDPHPSQSDFQEAENDLEKSATPETYFQAQESDSTTSEINFPPEETAKMAALIIAGKGKTETLKAMPGYSGRKHSLYSAYYDRLNKEIQQALQSEAQHEAA